jgi:hypothetical protein
MDSNEQETRVVHVRDNVPGAVYIGRAMPRQHIKASPFANPYMIGKVIKVTWIDDDPQDVTLDRRFAVSLFGIHLGTRSDLIAALPDLRGKPLACWCRHDGEAYTHENECHGDVLIEWLEEHTDDELRAMAKETSHAD